MTVSAVRDSGVDHSDERREHAADRDQHEHETDVPRKLNCSRRKKKSRVSHEDLKLIGLGKAVDEYARMRHARWNSRSTNEREKADASPERRASCSDRSSVGDDDQGAAVVGRVGPANRATTATRRVCFRRACACVVLPPIPSVLFERPLWEMIVALSVPVMTAWCLTRCSPVRYGLSGVALFVFGKVSALTSGCIAGIGAIEWCWSE